MHKQIGARGETLEESRRPLTDEEEKISMEKVHGNAGSILTWHSILNCHRLQSIYDDNEQKRPLCTCSTMRSTSRVPVHYRASSWTEHEICRRFEPQSPSDVFDDPRESRELDSEVRESAETT